MTNTRNEADLLEITDRTDETLQVYVVEGQALIGKKDRPSSERVIIDGADLLALLTEFDKVDRAALEEEFIPKRWVEGDRVLIEALHLGQVNLWQRQADDRWVLVGKATGETTTDEAIDRFVDGTSAHVKGGRSRATVIVQKNKPEEA